MVDSKIVWAFSGGAARFIALARVAQASKERGLKPDIIIGTSSGSILASLVAVSYDKPCLMDKAIEFGETLDVQDMFPGKGKKPFTKRGKPTFNAGTRIITGENHFGIQNIGPMFKKVFKQEHFELLKKSSIKCYAFGVEGINGEPKVVCLNDAHDIDDLIYMIELSSRITPFVQAADYQGKLYVDGGYISFCPAMWLFKEFNIKELLTVYSTPVPCSIGNNPHWNDNVLTVTEQMLKITTHYLGVKDAIIEELFCSLHNIPYMRIECPNGFIDEIYETDDDQLIALGNASRELALEKWNTSTLSKNDIYV